MADWESLNRLRKHRTILVLFTCLFIILLIFLPSKKMGSFSVSNESSIGNGWVKVKSGLNIREKPNTNSPTVYTIPYNKKVALIDTMAKKDRINNTSGYWFIVKYKNYKGYVWGANLALE